MMRPRTEPRSPGHWLIGLVGRVFANGQGVINFSYIYIYIYIYICLSVDDNIFIYIYAHKYEYILLHVHIYLVLFSPVKPELGKKIIQELNI